MRVTVMFSLAIIISLSVSANGQSKVELYQVTLYYQGYLSNPARSSIDFETGRGGSSNPSESSADFDLTYGGMTIVKDGESWRDWFRVRDSRSMLVDLGKKKWEDFDATPPFPGNKNSRAPQSLTNRRFVIDASAGSRDLSPYRQFVRVRARHTYLLRVLHGNRVVYVMFRVESLSTGDNCVLSWKRVTPPTVINEK